MSKSRCKSGAAIWEKVVVYVYVCCDSVKAKWLVQVFQSFTYVTEQRARHASAKPKVSLHVHIAMNIHLRIDIDIPYFHEQEQRRCESRFITKRHVLYRLCQVALINQRK